MAFLTDRKRASGLGSARSGTVEHWRMTISAMVLLPLVPLFLIAIGPIIGADFAAVQAHFAKPFPALITAAMLVVGLDHFRRGVMSVIEDYTHGFTRKFLIIKMIGVSYGLMAIGLFAIARMAF